MKSKTKVVKKVSVRQKRVIISDVTIQLWSELTDFIMERDRVVWKRIYRKVAQDLDVDILTVKNAFLLKIATQYNIDRITIFLERWKTGV